MEAWKQQPLGCVLNRRLREDWMTDKGRTATVDELRQSD